MVVRIFTAGAGGPSVSVQLNSRELARQAAAQATAERIEATAERRLFNERQEQPALYAGGGRVRPLGAAAPFRPRGVQASGNLSIGGPVQQAQGLVTGQPSVGRGNGEGLRGLADAIADVAVGRGWQSGAFDPNDPAGNGTQPALAARYPRDQYFREPSGPLYYWVPSTEASPGEWAEVPLGEGGAGIRYGTQSPLNTGHTLYNFTGAFDGELYWDTALNTLWYWDADDQVSSSTLQQGWWYGVSQNTVGDGPPEAMGALWGARYIDQATGFEYFWQADESGLNDPGDDSPGAWVSVGSRVYLTSQMSGVDGVTLRRGDMLIDDGPDGSGGTLDTLFYWTGTELKSIKNCCTPEDDPPTVPNAPQPCSIQVPGQGFVWTTCWPNY